MRIRARWEEYRATNRESPRAMDRRAFFFGAEAALTLMRKDLPHLSPTERQEALDALAVECRLGARR